jgi:hypothetical protein
MPDVIIVLVVAIVIVVLIGFAAARANKRAQRRLADAREEARRWYDRLGGQTMNLTAGGDDRAAAQALADAGERYTAAGAQLERAATVRQYALAGDTAIEGLQYIRAAREALGLDAGPDVPRLSGQARAGAITQTMDVDVGDKHYRASPQAGPGTDHYYPGGMVAGRPVPAGWYSEPWWKTALVAGAWGIGSMLIFDALISPGFDSGAVEGGYGDGYAEGYSDAGGDYSAGDFGGDAGGDFGGF